MKNEWVKWEIHWERDISCLDCGGHCEHILRSPDIGILNQYVMLIVCRHLAWGRRCNGCHILTCSPFEDENFYFVVHEIIMDIDFHRRDLFLEIIRLALIRSKKREKKKIVTHRISHKTYHLFASHAQQHLITICCKQSLSSLLSASELLTIWKHNLCETTIWKVPIKAFTLHDFIFDRDSLLAYATITDTFWTFSSGFLQNKPTV